MPEDSRPPAEVAEPTVLPRRSSRPSGSSGGSFWRELPFLIVIALVLALLIKTFLVQAFYIPSASMENTLQGGNPSCDCGSSPGHPYDRVLVNKLVYDFRSPHRGEIVVFKGPPDWPNESQLSAPGNPVARFFHDVGTVIGLTPASGSSDFIKRVIGVGGDTIACKSDVLTVNGHRLVEPYLYPHSHQCSSDNFEGRTVHVPPGDIWVMGDHRDDSEDSRVNGPVPVSDVIGRAFAVIWPASDWTTLPVPATFSQTGLAVGGSGNWVLVVLVVLAIVVAVVAFVAVHRRRRRRSSYPAGDGPA